jgi:hypothetical protein
MFTSTKLPFTVQLQLAKERALASCDAPPVSRQPDPWEKALAAIVGEKYCDCERISTQAALDYLNIKRSHRTTAATRRLAIAMRHLGWERSRWRPSRTSHKVRGFSRAVGPEALDQPLSPALRNIGPGNP